MGDAGGVSGGRGFVSFAAGAGLAACDRLLVCEGRDPLDEDAAAAAAAEVLFWWAVADDARGRAGDSLGLALRFARDCAAHRRVTTVRVEGLGYPLTYPLRYDPRLAWRPTGEIAPGARALEPGKSGKPKPPDAEGPRQRDAYDETLAGREVRSTVVLVRELLGEWSRD
ncbi:hypothetical protein H9L10_03600 [Phycicoccus endophyticus]|uniref:Uncharacterized protein n=1 Tax=Phycicoccus endophyticus TaxID=1690220 RepID=A0A7G9R3H9_9MICO|nr:hypothetical protein [Phycicoccus endophyticus]NHI19910.1 hypothetical protein [Phycicoccus endophyticus]QNN50154.1 hypothetical protein H9L10_03600 [Phycicoccus endophyticus]